MLDSLSASRIAYHHVSNASRDDVSVRAEKIQADKISERSNISERSTQQRSRGIENPQADNVIELENSARQRGRRKNLDIARELNNYADIAKQYQQQTVLFRMMETMGGTGTRGAQSGLYLDTYV